MFLTSQRSDRIKMLNASNANPFKDFKVSKNHVMHMYSDTYVLKVIVIVTEYIIELLD